MRNYLTGNNNQNQQPEQNVGGSAPLSSQPSLPSTSPGSLGGSSTEGGSVHPTPVSETINTDTDTSPKKNVVDLINEFANPTSTTNHATGTPVSLNQNLFGAITVGGSSTTSATHTTLTPGVGNISYLTPPTNGQTFVTNDLKDSGFQTYTPASHSTFIMRVLEQLRQTLLMILQRLQPFGGVPVSQVE